MYFNETAAKRRKIILLGWGCASLDSCILFVHIVCMLNIIVQPISSEKKKHKSYTENINIYNMFLRLLSEIWLFH